ncbi:MAG: SDR family NAD(P)-dependent oxidoreductase [Ignavibacteriaceae bacterium]|jgi:Dehydrogenases with different specificities (related to short-chain alcohol dehydrogenases)|nr:MAG: 3-ketoacyl-(acyl-carrier-protein) reductase [Chlorobi bacterium OLB4]MBW7855199.1 SDR family oxidoreductase [Ignavibacteria bacterium]MEB2330240.1 SDR family NAD(P)-dependent oxidoreductase [Ignavibacteriaceae bacterium]OQY77881.1 MAG: hypothetical protein B6D43_05045 [Ignavibacteriales bacterium UTCHB1]
MNRNVIVTGAAKGIGRAIAERLINESYHVIAFDKDQEGGSALQKEFYGKLDYYNIDIGIETDIRNFFEKFNDKYSDLYGLVNNAGIIRDNLIWKMSLIEFDTVLSINLRGTWMLCREASIVMKSQNYGRIVNIASRAWLGNIGQSNYSASKAGVIGLTRVLALELGKYNVLVNAVAPGLIDTPLTRQLDKEVLTKLIQSQPTRSMGKPEDVANAVSFLLSPGTNFITGQTIYIDGGKSIGAGL